MILIENTKLFFLCMYLYNLSNKKMCVYMCVPQLGPKQKFLTLPLLRLISFGLRFTR